MNTEKINDFVNVWAKAVGLNKQEDIKYIDIIKSDIIKRCAMYEEHFPTISIKDDSCSAYIIKPVNGKYSFEDFLLNRLMLGIRDISFTEALEDNSGDYIADYKSLNVNVELIEEKIENKATRHKGLEGKSDQIIRKTIEHELGHCFKTSFNDGFLSSQRQGIKQDNIYKNIIEALLNFENGKYRGQIKTLQEFNLQEGSKKIKSGVRNAKTAYDNDWRVEWIDELLNESEALELANIDEVQERCMLKYNKDEVSLSGNYVNVYNYISAYSTFTGYGKILKSLLGKEDTFKAEYMSNAADIFKQFDQEYADIVKVVWEIDPQKIPPMQCIFIDFHSLMEDNNLFNEKIMLKLDEFFARCYARKTEKLINQSNGILSQESKDSILREIEQFQLGLTSNSDPKKREQLMHNIIFNNIKTRINELSIEQGQQKDSIEGEKTKVDNEMMNFANDFIREYNDAEDERLYKKRSEYSLIDIERVQNILDLYYNENLFARTIIPDLEGYTIGQIGDKDFKVQYSEKQVSAMARLLKTAKLLTESKKLNTEGRNYLEDFINIPNIDNILRQMKDDFKDKNSYIYRLRQKSRENRANGNIPFYPLTEAEIEATDLPSTDALHQGLKQEMGISNATKERLKREKEEERLEEERRLRQEEKDQETKKANQESKEEIPQEEKAESQFKRLKEEVYNSDVTNEEYNVTQKEIQERREMKRLMFINNITQEQERRRNYLKNKYPIKKQKENKKGQGQTR